MFCMNCGLEITQPQGRYCPRCRKPADVFVKAKKAESNAMVIVAVIAGIGFALLIVLGIMAAIAIPKFADLVRKSSEGATKGNLGAIRSALSIYYGDNEGIYPVDMTTLTIGNKYLNDIPQAKSPPFHPDSAEVTTMRDQQGLTDTGGWAFVNEPNSSDWGVVVVNCTHTDTKGVAWHTY